MVCHVVQVARIKYEQSSSLVTEDQKELTEADQEQLETLRQKRWMDLITRQCSTVLKSVQSHKVSIALRSTPCFSLPRPDTDQVWLNCVSDAVCYSCSFRHALAA